ncbi:hypothetical protein SOMG_03268 [Schizosaccharomyces osmophilus]|uniref:Uncharacterized protein n=1 Tax=Schizosaccharomyces osmophilus TaxID=2545709 RepID=A0AAE9WDJ6_9SCHI|nr:uncharacterized protein SOMG_03268 [Schizosaccharomyces osmophilus]WBW73227.1 hypothetical protein SOMG_03268 [Schizosaccharomyces osmophilus]
MQILTYKRQKQGLGQAIDRYAWEQTTAETTLVSSLDGPFCFQTEEERYYMGNKALEKKKYQKLKEGGTEENPHMEIKIGNDQRKTTKN